MKISRNTSILDASLWLLAATALGACSGSADGGGEIGAGGNTTVGDTGGKTSVGSTGGAASGGSKANGGAAASGGAATGGAATGGKSTTGGAATGGRATGGAATGGAATGGKATGGAATGGAATGGRATGGAATGGTPTTGSVFNQCRFHFGANDSSLTSNATMRAQMDYYQPGWMGTNGDTFDHGYVCTYAASSNAMTSLVPAVVSYIAAGYAKRHHSLCDCNVSGCSGGNLCSTGAQYIAQDWSAILAEYQSFANGYATNCNGLGTTRPIIFKMEPDWFQYTNTSQGAAWTFAQAGSKMTELVNVLKAKLPLARFAIDVSPWVGTSPTAGGNGKDNGAAWYSNFNMGLFTFAATSGGGTGAATTLIRSSNLMTWAGLNSATGKPILADTGYGANGGSAGHDAAWDVVSNINARMADGVVAITQYNPSSSWGTTISGIRSQLNTPKYCP